MKLALFPAVLSFGLHTGAQATDPKIAAQAINALGVDLYRTQAAGDANLLLSPYSIQNALAMTYAGADGDTRSEMQRVLHYPEKDDTLREGFAALADNLSNVAATSVKRVEAAKKHGGPGSPIELRVANRLFARTGYQFRPAYFDLVKRGYGAPVELLDFSKDEALARTTINRWSKRKRRTRFAT